MRKDLTIISSNVVARGKVNSKGSLKIDGKFEGDIIVSGDVFIDKTGEVKANVKGDNITVSGSLKGNVTAERDIVVNETGKIKGKMASSNIKIMKGASTLGKISINSKIKEEDENPEKD